MISTLKKILKLFRAVLYKISAITKDAPGYEDVGNYSALAFSDQGDAIYYVRSYAQEGEDMILRRIFGDQNTGFYVDVGAHHPKRFSNTYLFYERGWSGLNIDALPGSMERFKRERPRDINLEVAIGQNGERTFFVFNEPALNSFDKELSYSRVNDLVHIVKEETIKTKTLEAVLAEHLPVNQKIDFLSVDVEGLDLEVLQSNNWDLFRPNYVLVECFDMSMKEIKDSQLYQLICGYQYEFFAKTVNSVIFKDEALEIAQ